jgi:hypothetical protein
MPGLQEAPENMLFCPTKLCHLSTAACPAENRDEACDQQVAKVMPRVVCTRIGDVIEGGEENVRAGNGLRKGASPPRNPSPRKPQEPSDQAKSQTRFPCGFLQDRPDKANERVIKIIMFKGIAANDPRPPIVFFSVRACPQP